MYQYKINQNIQSVRVCAREIVVVTLEFYILHRHPIGEYPTFSVKVCKSCL